jgi:hypothetical protein
VDKDLSAQIDAGVDDAMVQIEADRQERGDTILPSGGSPGEGDEGGESPIGEEKKGGETEEDPAGGEGPGADAVTDELLERAVKAGLPLSEARKFPNASMLGSICDRLEGLNKADAGKGGGEGATAGADEAGDPLAEIPDLDPNEYDEEIVKGFKAMKGIIRQQQDTIKGLRSPGKNDGESWFDSKVSGLGEAVGKAIKQAPEKMSALKEKFDVLFAGYKAANMSVDKDTIFEQATAIVLGDVKAQASDAARADRLRNREGQFISRPGGAGAKPRADAFEETAADIDGQFFAVK